jgi:hypothetical protein
VYPPKSPQHRGWSYRSYIRIEARRWGRSPSALFGCIPFAVCLLPPVFPMPSLKPPRYQPANSLESPRFSGVRTFARLPYVQDPADVDVAIVGLPFDTGATFKVGARFGPEAVRGASL